MGWVRAGGLGAWEVISGVIRRGLGGEWGWWITQFLMFSMVSRWEDSLEGVD